MLVDTPSSAQSFLGALSSFPISKSDDLGFTYLTWTTSSRQPLCGNAEGWGPLSPFRYDFTPCFLDVWISTVALYGIAFGAVTVWWLLTRKDKAEVEKDWHFWTKLAVIGAIISTTVLQTALQMVNHPDVWIGDFSYWTSILTIASLGVVSSIQYLEHTRLRNASGVVLFYWLFLLLVFGIKLRSLISQHIYQKHLLYFITFCLGFGLAGLEFVLEWLVPKKRSAYDALGDDRECPSESANIFSILTFSWMSPMMKYGYKQYITEEDLWDLAEQDTTRVTGDIFQDTWNYELQNKKHPSLWIALFRGFSGPYFQAAIFKTTSDLLAFVQPQLLRLLISFIDSYRGDEPQPVVRGTAIALAMFTVSVMQTLCLYQSMQRVFQTGTRLKSSVISAIYAKSLRLSNEGRAAKSTGDIVNLMGVDSQRLQELANFGQHLWSAPLQIFLCMVSLHQLLGYSMFAGVTVMIIMIPLNGLIARMLKTLQKRQMKNKDARTRLIAEIISNMKSIKLFAWSSAFMNKLNHIRNDRELVTLRKIGAAQAFSSFMWSATPFLVSCSTFAVFVMTQDKPLTTEIVFPALALFNLLMAPLTVLPMVVTAITEASVAVGRLTAFFIAEELQPDAIIRKETVQEIGEESVTIRDATFTWDRYGNRNALEYISFTAHKGELSCIVGRVGSGKSSLIQAILGDLYKVNGEVTIYGSIAYVAQQSWVMNTSVRENITFGHRWDPKFYQQTVNACALQDDFNQLPDGDKTQVGERGISLSGGQKARLTLARAVYSRADIYLLDDCLSAVDQHVGRHLIDNVLGAQGLLKGKTRILATNSIPVLIEADFITFIRDGNILEQGPYTQLMAMKGEITKLVNKANNQNQGDTVSQDNNDSTPAMKNRSLLVEEEIGEGREGLGHLDPKKPAAASARRSSTSTLRRASMASFRGRRRKLLDKEGAASKTKQGNEFSEQGKVKWNVYGEYAKASNLFAMTIYALTLIGAQTAEIGGSVWLKRWSEINGKFGGNPQIGKNIGIYVTIGIGSAGLVFVQSVILWISCSIEASRKLHERMALAIFRSPMSFFETTPAGRILNRFSSDIYRIDESLARQFNQLFMNSARAIFILMVISLGTPIFIVLITPLTFFYLYMQRYYLKTKRELKRLDSISRSPIYAHFQESLGGISTIRAYCQQERFALENEWRVDANLRAYIPSINANRWLGVRLEFIGSVIILSAAGFAIISVSTGNGLSAGMVGLTMSYALQITQSLNSIVRLSGEVETGIVSVERVLEYARLPSEAPDILRHHRPPISWPRHGAIRYINYSTRYRPGLDLVLKNINLDFKPREKVGVVGRTGAGKSSLTLSLFRIIEPSAGSINIDNLNTSTIGLLDLRQRLTIIPQDAALFEGTIRDNLDPGLVHEDTELWSVLEHARLKDHVTRMTGGLEAKVYEGGSNLSQGQRQLVSLARALLTPTNILILDEATAAVDVETDALLQEMLHSNIFSNRTIITIAHRINTIIDSDRIVVLDKGEVAEFDRPAVLLQRKGLFYELVREAGLLESMLVQNQGSGRESGYID